MSPELNPYSDLPEMYWWAVDLGVRVPQWTVDAELWSWTLAPLLVVLP